MDFDVNMHKPLASLIAPAQKSDGQADGEASSATERPTVPENLPLRAGPQAPPKPMTASHRDGTVRSSNPGVDRILAEALQHDEDAAMDPTIFGKFSKIDHVKSPPPSSGPQGPI